jgi:hypothetical protein
MEASAARMGRRLAPPLQIRRHFPACGNGVGGRVKPGHDERRQREREREREREAETAGVAAPYAFFFTSLMLEKTMPSARSLT